MAVPALFLIVQCKLIYRLVLLILSFRSKFLPSRPRRIEALLVTTGSPFFCFLKLPPLENSDGTFPGIPLPLV